MLSLTFPLTRALLFCLLKCISLRPEFLVYLSESTKHNCCLINKRTQNLNPSPMWFTVGLNLFGEILEFFEALQILFPQKAQMCVCVWNSISYSQETSGTPVGSEIILQSSVLRLSPIQFLNLETYSLKIILLPFPSKIQLKICLF